MKTALVHDWLVTLAGAEKVLESIYELYPAPIYTLLHGNIFENAKVNTSFIQKLPNACKNYRKYLPLFPRAIESFDLSEYDLIISSSHAVAKGIKKREDQLHICYCHTPMRYAWDLRDFYLKDLNFMKRILAKPILKHIQKWDLKSSSRVDHFIANSNYVAKRIEKNYGRSSTVIYPPVDVNSFSLKTNKENFYLAVSRLVPYKKIDMIVRAFSNMPERKLVVIGDGPEMAKIKKLAGRNVELLGYQEDGVLKEMLSRAKAFIFAAEEDFGILPVEAMASGTPVIAYGAGGALETVLDNKTGLFFNNQTEKSLIETIERFEGKEFDYNFIYEHAKMFDKSIFKKKFKTFVEDNYESNNSCRRKRNKTLASV